MLYKISKKILGHIDYLIIGEDGTLHLYLYKTTSEFLDYFGLANKEELPKFEKQVEEAVEDDTDLYHSKYVEE